jgi:hypothetical protein
MLCQVPVRSSWLLWQQGCLPLLQQLEDQEWRPQMPLNAFNLCSLSFIPPRISTNFIVGCISLLGP